MLYLMYENADADIVDSFYMETMYFDESVSEGLGKLVDAAKKKIDELIMAIKKFFEEFHMKKELKKLKDTIRAAASSQEASKVSIDANVICANIDRLMHESTSAQSKISKYSEDLKSGKITAAEFDKLVEKEIKSLEKAKKPDSKKAFNKKVTSVKKNASEAGKVVQKYEKACNTIQSNTVSSQERMKKTSEKSPEAAVKTANAYSKYARAAAIEIAAIMSVAFILDALNRKQATEIHNIRVAKAENAESRERIDDLGRQYTAARKEAIRRSSDPNDPFYNKKDELLHKIDKRRVEAAKDIYDSTAKKYANQYKQFHLLRR